MSIDESYTGDFNLSDEAHELLLNDPAYMAETKCDHELSLEELRRRWRNMHPYAVPAYSVIGVVLLFGIVAMTFIVDVPFIFATTMTLCAIIAIVVTRKVLLHQSKKLDRETLLVQLNHWQRRPPMCCTEAILRSAVADEH